MRPILLLIALLLAPASVLAQDAALGRWVTIDDASGRQKSVVEVFDAGNGSYGARVVRLLDTSRGPNPLCDKCSGSRRNQPILGMVIAWDLRRDGEGLTGGRILDPENGKTYSVRMTPVEGGRRLQVRGFLGIALLGRTQVWRRE